MCHCRLLLTTLWTGTCPGLHRFAWQCCSVLASESFVSAVLDRVVCCVKVMLLQGVMQLEVKPAAHSKQANPANVSFAAQLLLNAVLAVLVYYMCKDSLQMLLT